MQHDPIEFNKSPDIISHMTGSRRPKIGLALGSGVARGWSHIGVAKKLAEQGIKPDVIAGTSIGAVVGGAIAAGKLSELEQWALDLKELNFFRFLDWKLGSTGLFGGNKLNELMIEKFGDINIEDLDTPFTAVACELKTGHEIWLKNGVMSDAIQASFALPGVFEPISIDGRWLVDGALVNPTPVSICRAQGCELVIAVNLAEDLYGRSKARIDSAKGKEVDPFDSDDYGVFTQIIKSPSTVGRTDAGKMFKKLFKRKNDAPSMFTNMVASLSILQNRLSRSRLAGDPPDVTITPRTGHIGLMEFYRADELIKEGEIAFDEALPHLLDAIDVICHRLNH